MVLVILFATTTSAQVTLRSRPAFQVVAGHPTVLPPNFLIRLRGWAVHAGVIAVVG